MKPNREQNGVQKLYDVVIAVFENKLSVKHDLIYNKNFFNLNSCVASPDN